MDEELKKEVWRVFSVASFLFITIFFILPYLIQISTYFHVKAHMDSLGKYGIESSYSFNLLETIPNFLSYSAFCRGSCKISQALLIKAIC